METNTDYIKKKLWNEASVINEYNHGPVRPYTITAYPGKFPLFDKTPPFGTENPYCPINKLYNSFSPEKTSLGQNCILHHPPFEHVEVQYLKILYISAGSYIPVRSCWYRYRYVYACSFFFQFPLATNQIQFTVGPLLKDTLERTTLYKGHKFMAASTMNICNIPFPQRTPLK